MKKIRFNEEHTVRIFCETVHTPLPEVANCYGVSVATIYDWRRRFGGLQATDDKYLDPLEQDNYRSNKMMAERNLTLQMMMNINSKEW